ncbi:hypothetical protein ACJ41O_001963 [Fusarium nematophilum]
MLFLLPLVALLAGLVSANKTTCPLGAHIIVVRGSLESQGPGIMGEVADKVLEGIPGSDMESLVYPALYDPYVPSQTEGVKAMGKLVRGYAKKCPRTKVVILGYSQGAHITMDTMCGASSDGFPETMPQLSYIADKVAAIVLMGDPSRTDGQPFNIGTSQGNGIFPRHRPGGCQCISGKTISICDAGDPFCEAGGKDLAVHMGYVTVWGEYAANYVVSKYNSA